ncbi:hypothetical protein IX55_16970 [Paracoccus sanguinis]|nr:hypothetical protein IX55_16970 [Paracoccus sanguinis]
MNSFVNFRLTMSDLRFLGHDLIFVSTKPAAGHGADWVDKTTVERDGACFSLPLLIGLASSYALLRQVSLRESQPLEIECERHRGWPKFKNMEPSQQRILVQRLEIQDTNVVEALANMIILIIRKQSGCRFVRLVL